MDQPLSVKEGEGLNPYWFSSISKIKKDYKNFKKHKKKHLTQINDIIHTSHLQCLFVLIWGKTFPQSPLPSSTPPSCPGGGGPGRPGGQSKGSSSGTPCSKGVQTYFFLLFAKPLL